MEIAKVLMEAFGLKEDPSKNDLTIAKRGLALDVTEVRDVGSDIQFMTGETTVTAFKAFLEGMAPGAHIGHVSVVVSDQEECPRFLAFMKRQAKRLKFKLIVFVSPLPPEKFGSMEQYIRDRGGLRMQ